MKLDRFFIALSCAALSGLILLFSALICFVAAKGVSKHWPQKLQLFELKDGSSHLGVVFSSINSIEHPGRLRHQLRIASRDLHALGFKWIEAAEASAHSLPPDAWCIERQEFGDAYVCSVTATKHGDLRVTYPSGEQKLIAKSSIIRSYQPNSMPFLSKLSLFLEKWLELISHEPREANTEGGLFPAIFGTVMLVIVMSLVSFPFGVITGIYMSEYAGEGWLPRAIRIAVNNLAGIPSIVFGIFGLGFFVYRIGGGIDQFFFSDALPRPTFGTGGLLWSSITLGLLTVPVVIVSTEQALAAIPKGMRAASMALGAKPWQTLVKVLIPIASPGILTGFILAMTRAAGEVAPLMMTGVVKLAPSLPLDHEFPYLHLDRKFMHLGFHIYDMGFQSPNIEAAMPIVFVTTLLLLAIVITMTSGAIYLRHLMQKKVHLSKL